MRSKAKKLSEESYPRHRAAGAEAARRFPAVPFSATVNQPQKRKPLALLENKNLHFDWKTSLETAGRGLLLKANSGGDSKRKERFGQDNSYEFAAAEEPAGPG